MQAAVGDDLIVDTWDGPVTIHAPDDPNLGDVVRVRKRDHGPHPMTWSGPVVAGDEATWWGACIIEWRWNGEAWAHGNVPVMHNGHEPVVLLRRRGMRLVPDGLGCRGCMRATGDLSMWPCVDAEDGEGNLPMRGLDADWWGDIPDAKTRSRHVPLANQGIRRNENGEWPMVGEPF